MLKIERQNFILNKIYTEGKVLISSLSNDLEVSEDTIRRDLIELDQKNQLKRVRSGAIRIGPSITDFSYRENKDIPTKKEIAKKVIPNLKQNTTIMVDGSSSNLELIKLLPENFMATIITNCPPIIIELANKTNIKVISIGGEFYKRSQVNLGVSAYKQIKKIYADYYLMGVYNIDSQYGCSVPTQEEADIKEVMSQQSDKVLCLVTNDKFETISSFFHQDIHGISTIFTDNVATNIKKSYEDSGVTIVQ
ncbi:DeoR/GlpR family DNA-binding transcription regulator [Aerococcus loyolae]|uniref:DeoR/GlpR family DNA-binding transcription regulator n=1 Tax=Aerococcus loyolae TaxID=2976809 RepID=A0ABT4BYM4_9LACT|nr:DeoR/GlpR family DNA-binding transcription regulator [Aerococcus loyolae]MCY3025255.1 DeoR/GlpR family DNA-binding transcription regulator [Aerococcus loyolae]MCY3027044.1 DeoR/GlpR family DNA-binding transcription regulator [Aerococcus loyolae]MCY3028627.1 DeoR/GlpR family DNA-binding transcription regulator [Aerococcus loyolae]OAM70579.1 DeoR family transcriptional regulator [Aerococcus loyolae]